MRLFAGLLLAFVLSGGGCSMKHDSNDTQNIREGARDRALRGRLSDVQYRVTQECGTEPPFANPYWDNNRPGLYLDVVSGEPLFASVDKFDSGTGWPSFVRPLTGAPIAERVDASHGMVRVEIRNHSSGSHLGHVFDDGPQPTGKRYCINSAALRFVPLERLEEEGLARYLPLFGSAPSPDQTNLAMRAQAETQTGIAILAGGCFWGMQQILRSIPGVLATRVGYTGGMLENPGYDDLHDGRSGHAEAVRIEFDPDMLSYESLLEWFFRMHDPTTRNRQGNDIGSQYRSAIFVLSPAQRRMAEQVRARINANGRWAGRVVTEIVDATRFWDAEEWHQEYLVKHPGGYTCHWLRSAEDVLVPRQGDK